MDQDNSKTAPKPVPNPRPVPIPSPPPFDDKHPWRSLYLELEYMHSTLKQVLAVGQQLLTVDQQILSTDQAILKALKRPNRLVVKLYIGGIERMNPVTMTDIQLLTMLISALDADGNPTSLQAPIAATLSDDTFGTLSAPVQNSDGTQTLTFTPATVAGKLGGVTINLTTVAPDAILTGSVSVTVGGSAAASLGVQATVGSQTPVAPASAKRR